MKPGPHSSRKGIKKTWRQSRLFQAVNQSCTLILWRRNNVMFHCFPPHCATLLYWYCWFWVGLLFTYYSLSRLPPPSPPNPDELKWTQPLSPSQQLGVTDFKARDMNNQTVIFSFSSSCYWPDFMISPSLPPSLLPSFPPAFSLSCMLSHANPLPSLPFSPNISLPLNLCPSLLSADRWFVQEAAADSESGGQSRPGGLLLIICGHQQRIINNGKNNCK